MSSISTSMVHSGALDQNSILQGVRPYQPAFQPADVALSLSPIDQNQAMLPTVSQYMQQIGISYYLNVAISQANKIGNAIRASGGAVVVANALRPVEGVVQPDRLPPGGPPGYGSGRGGYNCAVDGAAIFAAGLAFATLSVMTLGAVDVLAGAAWAGIALWGESVRRAGV
jgi:hypothetical protein